MAEFIGTVDFLPAWREQDRLLTEVGSTEWNETADDLDQLEVMMRPDCLNCYPSESGQGVVTSRDFRGAFYVYRVELQSGNSVRCLVSHTSEYPVGSKVNVELRQGHALQPFVNGLSVGK